ncbi:MAG: hypothetical protein CL946_05005 [Ectothiorhodospiraceae bacterium]|nr:hypothetical protein [Ectothiorhodospiraceae bacterium]
MQTENQFNFTLLHRISAGIVFVFSSIIFLMTVAPTLSFWDCGEFITSAVTLGIPHPPGAPFFQLVGRFFSLLPVGDDLGYRVNLISTFSSSLTVLFVYLSSMRLFRMWQGEPKEMMQGLVMIIAAAAGALTLSFSDTFWFNAGEAEVYGIGMFFISIVVWLALEWYAKVGVLKRERTLLLIAYLMGLSIGVHLLSLLALFFVFVLVYFRDRDDKNITPKTIGIFAAAAAIGFAVIYPGIVKYIPQLLSTSVGRIVLLLVIGGAIFIVAYKMLHVQFRMAILATLLIVLGYSTYSLVIIRSNQDPALNENDPSTFPALYSYLNRDQYGSYPLLRGYNFNDATGRIDFNANDLFPRRWNPDNTSAYANYDSDLEYFMSFQLGHIYYRYFMWNFVGRAGDRQDAPWVLFDVPDTSPDAVAAMEEPEERWAESLGYPNRYYAIPLILGLLGLYYHFRRDRKTWIATALLFFMTGVGLVIYFNMAEPQVRERDYFFVGSFYVFAMWVGIGIYAAADYARKALKENQAAAVGVTALLLLLVPGNMLFTNYQTHNRHYNYVAFDYAYNLLQSCDQDAILFTGGDNDTFPLWYLQYVAGVRRDIRLVNLSLLNTPWYAKQLIEEQPYGAKTVGLGLSAMEIENLRPQPWETNTYTVNIDPNKFFWSSLEGMDYAESLIDRDSLPSKIQWTIEPTFTDPAGNRGIRNQDILIIRIIENNFGDRPIYFALSTSPNDRIGLDEYLVVEGLAYRLTPVKFPFRGDRYYANVNIPETMKYVMNSASKPDSNRAKGFMFRELNNPKVLLDEASARMVMSYRFLFIGLGQVMQQEGYSDREVQEVLERMEYLMPKELHDIDMTLKTDLVTSVYAEIGYTEGVKKYADELEAFYLKIIETDLAGRNAPRSPFHVLLTIYEALGEYDKGLNVLNRFKQAYPNDPGVQQRLQQWNAQFGKTESSASQQELPVQ